MIRGKEPAPPLLRNKPIEKQKRNEQKNQSRVLASCCLEREAQSAEHTYFNEAGIQKIRLIAGNFDAQMFRRTKNNVAEFYVISYWKSRDAIHKFARNDIKKRSLLPKDRQYLSNFELQVKCFDVLVDQ